MTANLFTRSLYLRPLFHALDGEPNPDPNPDPNPNPEPEPKPVEKTFYQKDVDAIVQKRLAAVKKAQEESLKKVSELQSNLNLTAEEKEALQIQLDNLQNTLLTKEEIAAKEKKELESKFSTDLSRTKQEADVWRGLYTNTVIDHAIFSAATESEAVRGEQILALLKPNTRLTEELGLDGKPTGGYTPKVKFVGRDKDGKPITLDLTVAEAVKQMKDMPDLYGNLFKSNAVGGIGGGTLGTGQRVAIDPNDTEAYIKARKSGKTPDELLSKR